MLLLATMSKAATGKIAQERDEAEELHEALSELVRLYQFRDRDRICCHDVSVTQCYAIDALVRRGSLTLGDLASELYLDKSTTSRVVATLVRKGYVERAVHPVDARAVLLRGTLAGRRLHERIRQDLVGEARELLDRFGPDVRQGAIRLIRLLSQAASLRIAGGGCGQ